MEAEIKQMPAQRVLSVEHIGPYNRINEAFAKLGEIAGRSGLFAQGAAGMVALYYDDPQSTPPEHLRSGAGLIVPDTAKAPPSLTESRLPAGEYACTVHVGPYEELGETWAKFLGEWLPASGRHMASSPSYELYLNDPSTTPKEQLRTEICVPLA